VKRPSDDFHAPLQFGSWLFITVLLSLNSRSFGSWLGTWLYSNWWLKILHWQRSFDHQKCHGCIQSVDFCCIWVVNFHSVHSMLCYVSDIHVYSFPWEGVNGNGSFELGLSLLDLMSCCYGLDEIWQSFIELCVLNAVKKCEQRLPNLFFWIF
jgi:hypothetical protein